MKLETIETLKLFQVFKDLNPSKTNKFDIYL